MIDTQEYIADHKSLDEPRPFYDVEDALSAYLLRNMRCTQTSAEASSYLDHFIWEKSESFSGLPSPSYNKEWVELLSKYQNYALVYIHDEEQMKGLLPIISQLDSPVLIQLLSPSQILCQDLILYQELLLKTIADYRLIPLLKI